MNEQLSFEEARRELERIVAQLETGQAGLEDVFLRLTGRRLVE